MKITPLFLVAVLVVSCSNCSSDPPKTVIPVCVGGSSPEAFIATTFNTGLGPGLDVPYATPRIPYVAQAIAAAPWDVLCLDETWTDPDHDALVAALGVPEEQIVTTDTRGRNEDPADRCAAGELDDGLACMRANCGGIPDEDVTMCAAQKCQGEGFALYIQHPHCFNCVLASAGRNADQIKETCEGPGDSRMFGGRNGVMLVSRHPLRNVESIQLPSSTANRVGLFATVDVAGGSIEVACTHLTGVVNFINPPDTRFASWEDEMKAQLKLLSDKLAARANGGQQLLLGDLNNGPKYTGDMQSDTPTVWSYIESLGFESPAAETDPSICSRCQGNLAGPTGDRYLIDHVLTRGAARLKPECAAQAFDQPVTLTDLAGKTQTTSLSDHYGITVRFSP